MRRFSTRQGMTLIEMLFATAIAGVVLTGAIVMLSRDTELSRGALAISAAQTKAQQMLGVLHEELARSRALDPLASGTAEVLSLSGSPPANLYDGRALESQGPVFFRGDGTQFAYRLPLGVETGAGYIGEAGASFGALVRDAQGVLSPSNTAHTQLRFRAQGTLSESERFVDLNRDGDQLDVFELGQLVKSSFANPGDVQSNIEVPLGPRMVLQEREAYGSDLDGDGFEDPLFLWDPLRSRLSLRLFVVGDDPKGRPAVRRVQSSIYLRNGAGME